jgi:hypothetical protein
VPVDVTVQKVGDAHRQVLLPVKIERAFAQLPPETAGGVDALPLGADHAWAANHVWKPDIDDRGFLNPQRDVRGPAVGLAVGKLVAVKVRRLRVPPGLTLVATVAAGASPTFSLANPLDLTERGGSRAIGADGIVILVGLLAGSTHALEVRWGAADGPVVAQAHVVVHAPLTLRLTYYLCTLRGVVHGHAPDEPLTDAFVPRRALSIAQAMWIPAGVNLDVAAGGALAVQGYVSADEHADRPTTVKRHYAELDGSKDLSHFVNQAPADRAGVFFLPWAGALGFAVRTKADGTGRQFPGNRTGVFVAIHGQAKEATSRRTTLRAAGLSDAEVAYTIGNDLAHEIGHLLDLEHSALPAWSRQATSPNSTYHRRALMYNGGTLTTPMNPPPWHLKAPAPRFTTAGYGEMLRGMLVSLKPHTFEPRGAEAPIARAAVQTDATYAASPTFDSDAAFLRYKNVVECQKSVNIIRTYYAPGATVAVNGVWDQALRTVIAAVRNKPVDEILDPAVERGLLDGKCNAAAATNAIGAV